LSQVIDLVEREAVLAALADHLAAAAGGHGRVVLVSGEAGVGKSAVLGRFADETGGVAEVLLGWCEPLSTPRPLGPWADVAADLGASVVAELDRPDGEVGVSRLFRAVLAALQTGGPRVLIIEDVHWADAASLDLLRLLARRIERLPVLLVASYRDDEIGPGHPIRLLLGDFAGVSAVHRCPVEPLSARGVAELAAGRSLDADELYRVTGGNPFFVTEVLASDGHEIPSTIGDAIAGRLAWVSAAARRVAELVAVLGSPAQVPLITSLVPAAADLLAELVSAGIVQPSSNGVGFRHELARMAVLDAVPAFERSRWHAQVLNRLRTDPAYLQDVALLAHHADAAADRDAVLEYAPAAAAQAAASGAHREAAAHYRRMLRFGEVMSPRQRAEVLERFARSSMYIAEQYPDTLDAWRKVIEIRGRLGDRLAEGDALRSLSFLLWPAGRSAEARRVGRRAVEILETLPPSRELAWAHANMCRLLVNDQNDLAAAEEHAARAESLAERFGDPAAGWHARFHHAFGRYANGSRDDAWADMHRIARITLDAGHAELAAHMTMCMSTYATTHMEHARAAEAYAVLVSLSRDRDLRGYMLSAEMYRAIGMLQRGRWDDGVELASRLLGRPGLFPLPRVAGLTALGLIRARRGDPGAWEPLDEVLTSFEPAGLTLNVFAARAEAAWLEGDPARAVAEARRGLDATTEHTGPWLTGELTRWIALASDERPSARAAEPFMLELAGDWQGAALAWERLSCPYDAALARLSGDVPALLTALETFESLGARPAAGIVTARLRELGVRAGTRGPRQDTRADPHGLTSRQREILDLVREGLTDSQIAGRLHLSAKTVNHHVGAVLGKLGVHSRAQAVRKMVEP
jgi:DNA-binding CsgD family transcriptional regulator/tetratricopeptide (TPR) repeat protein